jgi:broad specificity phosphatase PhoE
MKYDANDPFCDVDIVYIVRHGLREDQLRDPKTIKPPTNIPGDSPLADPEGLQQARAIAAFFLHLPVELRPSAVYSSGFYRTIQTASFTCQLLGIPLRVERGLGEWYEPTRKVRRRPAHVSQSCELFGLLDPLRPELGTLVEHAYEPQVVPSKNGETKRDMWLRCRRSARLLIEQHSFYGAATYEDEWQENPTASPGFLAMQTDDPPVRLLWVCHGASAIMMNSLLLGGEWKLQGECSTGSLTVFQRLRQDRPGAADLEQEYRLGVSETHHNPTIHKSHSFTQIPSPLNPTMHGPKPVRDAPSIPPPLDLESDRPGSARRENPFPMSWNPNLVDVIAAAYGKGFREDLYISPEEAWIALCKREMTPLESGTRDSPTDKEPRSAREWTIEQVDPKHGDGIPLCYKDELERYPPLRGPALESAGLAAMASLNTEVDDAKRHELDPHHILRLHAERTDPATDPETHVPSSWPKVDTVPLPPPLALRNWQVTLYDSLGHVFDETLQGLAKKNRWHFPAGEVPPSV